jgi:virginiamycin A acetyltransferase
MNNFKLRSAILTNVNAGNWALFTEDNVNINNTELFGTVFFGFGSYINSGMIRSYCEIGRYCSIGRNVSIGLGNHDINNLSTSPFFESLNQKNTLKLASTEPKRRVIIGNDVWIGDNVMIASGVSVGDGCVLAGGAVVTKDIPPYTVVGGVPAKHIKHRFSLEISEALSNIKWWNIPPNELKALPLGDIEVSIAALNNRKNKGVESSFPLKYSHIQGLKHTS